MSVHPHAEQPLIPASDGSAVSSTRGEISTGPDSPSEWYLKTDAKMRAGYQDLKDGLTAFEEGGYNDLGHLYYPHGVPQRDERQRGSTARALLEQEREHGQLTLPEDAVENEAMSDETTVVFTFRRRLAGGDAEVMIARPRSGELRTDPEDGEQLDPLFIALGINGDAKYPWTVRAFSQEGELSEHDAQAHAGRQVIGIRYPDKIKGTMRRVKLDEDNPDDSITVPELDKNQARPQLDILHELDVRRVDVLTESRGAIINTIAMDIARQEGDLAMFGDVINISPAGQGMESYWRAHSGAAAIAVMGLVRASMLRESVDSEAVRLKGVGNVPGGRFARDVLGWRREQLSVARTRKARLHEVTARLAESMNALNSELNQSLMHTVDPLDPAIREKRIRRQNIGNVPVTRTNFKGHAIPYGRREPVRWIDKQFQERRNARRRSNAA